MDMVREEMKPGEMAGIEATRTARPGLFFVIDVQKREIFVPQEMIEEESSDLKNGQVGRVIRWRKP